MLTRRQLALAFPSFARPRLAPRRLLLDSRLIEKTTDAALVIGKPRKDPANPLFGEDKPWEVRFDNLYANIHWDPVRKTYHCWYSPFIVDEAVSSTPRANRDGIRYRPRNREMGVCYATSSDGLRWTKPELNLVEFAGSKANNLVIRGPHGAGVLHDSHERDPARRYKLFYKDKHMAAAFSRDGLRWSAPVEFSEVDARGDTHNNVFWCAERNAYVAITRTFDPVARQRLVARAESPDFRHWSKAEEVLRASPADPHRQTYAMPVLPYHGLYLGLLMMFDTRTDSVNCELAWSPDTVTWQRVCPGSPLIPNGPAGSYDSGCVYAAFQPVVLPGEIRIYYGASNGPHTGWRDGFLSLARLRPEGFAAMEARQTGTVVTRPVSQDEAKLLLNADASGGAIRVGVLNHGELTLDNCRPVMGDGAALPVTWTHGSIASIRGRRVQFVFELRNARLYGF